MSKSPFVVSDTLQDLHKHGTNHFHIAFYETELNSIDTFNTPLHWHSEVQFLYVMEGSCLLNINNAEFALNPGGGLFINSGVLHSVRMKNNAPCKYYSINVGIDFFATTSSLVQQKFFTPFFSSKSVDYISFATDSEEVKKIKAIQVCSKEHSNYELLVYNILQNLLFGLIKEYFNPDNEKKVYKATDPTRAKAMLLYIQENYKDKITLADLGNVNNINASECCRIFKRVLGMSPFDYIMEYRITQSIDLLRDSKKNVTEIALSTGFTNTSYYIAAFKKFTGYTPKNFRNLFFSVH